MRALTATGIFLALYACAPAAAVAPPRWSPDVDAARKYAADRRGVVSFAVRTERRAWGHRRRRTVPAASVLKPMLMVAYLNHRSVRDRPLRRRDRRLLRPMIRRSDNTTASHVRNFVRNRGLRRVARRAKMRRFTPVAHPWGSSRVNAADQARFFLRLDRLVVRRHRDTALRLLASVVKPQRWGVGRVAPSGWRLHFKGGWGSGTGAVDHQVALLRRDGMRVAVAVMTEANGSHRYGKRTLRGVFRRLLRGLARVQ
ncbi:MAG TPA: serine hydrolase [Thermoleophilaceae bacterium]|nr:serine hydrolase [Thermoleophilaceae bacterium]